MRLLRNHLTILRVKLKTLRYRRLFICEIYWTSHRIVLGLHWITLTHTLVHHYLLLRLFENALGIASPAYLGRYRSAYLLSGLLHQIIVISLHLVLVGLHLVMKHFFLLLGPDNSCRWLRSSRCCHFLIWLHTLKLDRRWTYLISNILRKPLIHFLIIIYLN